MKLADFSPAKFRSSLARRGLLGTLQVGFSHLLGPLVLYSPRRIAKRIRDRSYDRRYGVDTSLAIDLDKLRIESASAALAHRYQASTERSFHETLAHVPVRRHEDFVFIDFGSGKGKCLLMASDYPFKKIIGVEFAAELNEVARSNFARYRSPRQKCRTLESVHADATTYALPADPGVYYFYNPFEAPLLSVVLENIRRSLDDRPRKLYVVYFNPAYREVFDSAAWLVPLKRDRDFCIYENRTDPPGVTAT